nr:MAG TPA: tail protein [Caudoviricetes sp.]
MIKIYDINDKLLMQAEVTSAAKREQEMSKSDYISLSFSAAEKIILPAGAYINYTYKIDKVREVTRKFLLLESYEPTQSDECSWKYTPQFQHPKMILSKTPFFIYTRNSQNIEVKQNVWSFVGTTSVLSGKIADFLNKDLMFGECGWKVIFQKVTANTINVSFSDNDFISALTAITNAIGDNCEWHIDYDDEIIYIGKVLVGATPVVLEVGKNVGVPSINNSKEVYYNAFSIFGGTRNITQVNSKGENVSSGDIRLQLDEGNGTISIDGKERSYSIDKYSTLDLRADKTKEPLFTKVLDFSQIFPSLNTYVYNVRGRVKYVLDENNNKIPIPNADGSIKEYKTFTVWYMRLAYPTTEKVEGKTIINTTIDDGITHYWYDFEVTDNLLIYGKNIGCSFEANFNTGALSTPLAGRGTNGDYVGFELTYHKEASSSHTSDDVSKDNFSVLAGDYEIIYQEDNEVIIPTNEAEMLIPRGDSKPSLKCNITVLYNIAMADTIYYEDAQDRLLEKAKEGIVRLLSDLNNYEVKSYSDVFLMDNPQLQIGQSVTYKDGHGYELATRVLKLSTNIDYDFIQSITIGNQAIKGTITQLKEDVQTIIASGGSNGSGGGYSVSQLRSLIAKYGSDNFISKQFNDTAHGTITFEKVQKFLQGLNIGDGNSKWSADGTLILFRLLTNNFSSGPYGQGAQIDEKGNLEVQSIYARQFISAPKFVFNEISVTKAEQWNTNGYGTIESVDTKNRIITLHLEENDYGSLQVGDICRGLYADIDNAHGADKIEEGALDDCNFVQHKGFFSTYFYVTHIITSEKGKFVFQYGKKSSVTPDPCAYMDFAQYGSFTDEKRQSSMYFSSRGNSYIEVLDGVCTWEVQPQNRVARYGWLGGLALVKKDGSIVRPEGNGIYVQDNIYFGGNINYLQGLSGLDDLREEAKAYDVSLSQYQSVITVDDMGNVINGLYTEDEAKNTKQYRISTAVFVRKGMDILLEEDGNTEDVTAGHYRVHAVSEDCEVMVQNSTIFVTAIRNIKDGVAGTEDDATFDYDAMRKATDAMVTIVVELEGKTSKMVQMPIRIQHDTLPFMVCDLSNESASVAWNTKTAKYIGLPIKTKVSLMYHNEPWAISSLNISNVAGLKTSMSIEGKAKVITIDADNLTADTLAQVTKMNITVVGRYAGANYEYTRELTILKSSDTVVYELIPSADSIVVDKDGNKTVNSVSCDVYATSSDDKRYKLTALPAGMSLKYGKSENATKDLALGAGVDVTSDDKMVTFALYDSNNNMLDKESIPVLAYGKDGKGIEYIFKLQNSAPSNPTPSDYATDTDYQRTDYVPTTLGWTDDPTGVDAVNLYEWVSKRVSVNGHWGAFSEPAEYAHFGKHAPKAKSSDDIVTIPTDSDGNALLAFREEVGFSLLVDGHECNISSIQKYSSTLSNVSCSISSNVATIKCEEGAKLGITSQTIVFKVTGTHDDGSTYIDYVTVKVVPNVTGSDGDGYEYIYYLTASSSASAIAKPSRTGGVLTTGWQDDPMFPTKDKQYVWVAYKQGEVGSDGEFSTPKLFNRFPKSISKQETKFIAWHSLTDGPDASTIWNDGSTSMPTNFSDDKPWLWKIIRTTYTDGTTDDVVSCEGYKAKDGIGIKSVNTYYALSDDMEQPGTSKFTYDTLSEVVISNNGDKYVWSADKVTYTNTDIGWTGIYCIGKCSDLTSVIEEYGTSASDTNEPTSWSEKYPTDAPKGTYIWSRDKIVWKKGDATYSTAQLIGYIAKDGENGVGSVVAYQREAVLPTQKPSVTSYDIYKNSDELGNKWQKSAPPAKEGLYSGGSISGTVLYNQNANGGNWQSGVSDGGYTWYKSPAVANNGIATMQIRFSTTVANQYVTFYIKAYSEANYDFILLSEIDSANVDRTNNYSFRVSGNGVVEKATLKCDKAGSHFVTVAYAKDVGGASFGDYGLVRMSTSENYVRMKPLLYRCDGEVASNKVIAWGNIYQAQGDKGDTGDKGDKGETGVGIASIQTYYLISSMSSGITTSSSGWSTNMVNPTSSKPYLWSYVKTTLSNGDITSSTPVIIGNFAEAGVMGEIGCIIRPSIWKSGVEYLNESALTNKQEKYIDLVYVEDASANDGWRQYMCALTHTSSSNNSPTSSGGSKYWTQLSDTGPIYAPLILAKNAVLNFTQGQQFNLVENGKIFASYRIPGSDEAALWLGGSTASSAPFSVDKNGSLKSTSGIIGGVEISQERLGVGVADVGNKTFKGAILSSEGIFTGYKSSYFGAGVFAADDPSGSTIQMYDKKALSTISVSSPSLYVRKYSPDSMILNNIDKYYGAALIVDVPKGVGVASLGNNVLGGLALSAVAGDLDIGSTDNLFQKNRGTVAYLTNSSGRRFYLPDNPHEGQVVIVIQGSTGNITFYHPGKRLVIQNTVKDSGGFYSGKQGQFNIFVYIGSMWYGTYSNG